MQSVKYGIVGAKTFTLFLLLFCLASGIASAGNIYKPAEQTGSDLFNLKQTDTLRQDDTVYYDDADDEEMYTPYEKWRIDTFDNWGKHKKISPGYVPDSSPSDTGNLHKQKGLSDKEKEAMLSCPPERINAENIKVESACSIFRRYNVQYLIKYNKFISA